MKLTNKRGFSLVELMVVVAIMGTLAAIAIPAYNEYRKSAKKTAYRTDLSALHKGWLAFGVELDSFCERETVPAAASIGNVGMASLTNSKLYGSKGLCSDPGSPVPDCTTCTALGSSSSCGAHNDGKTSPTSCGCTWANTGGNGPGKHNFIGFSNAGTGCDDPANPGTPLNQDTVRVLGESGGTATSPDSSCELNVTTYDMGVYGHISGAQYFGVSIDHNSVVSSETIKDTTPGQATSNCT